MRGIGPLLLRRGGFLYRNTLVTGVIMEEEGKAGCGKYASSDQDDEEQPSSPGSPALSAGSGSISPAPSRIEDIILGHQVGSAEVVVLQNQPDHILFRIDVHPADQ